MTYRISELAKTDLDCIYEFGLYRFGKIQADEYYLSLINKFILIDEKPYLFPPADYICEGYRKAAFDNTNTIYYRVPYSEEVEIMRIIGYQNL